MSTLTTLPTSLLLLCLWLLPAHAEPSDTAGGEPFKPEAIRQQMRWKLEATGNDLGTPLPLEPLLASTPEALEQRVRREAAEAPERYAATLHRTVEALIVRGDEPSRQCARTLLEALVALHSEEDYRAVVTSHGIEFAGHTRRVESGSKVYEPTPPNPQRPRVLRIRALAYEQAALFLLTGDRHAAEKGRDLLLRFAEVVPSWPLYDRHNRPHAQNEKAYLLDGTANGIWSVWHPLDLRESLPLLRAYDILRPTLAPADREKIETRLFVHQKELNDRIPRHRNLYTNLQGYRLPAQILFGRVLERPTYVHEAVRYLDELLRYSYTADGFWKEVTPGYHRQISTRLIGQCPLAAEGYSDPPGYTDPVDGTRFDQLDLHQQLAPTFARMEAALDALAMPDGSYASLNDAWPKKDRVPPGREGAAAKPALLGIAGVAKLGMGEMSVFLTFHGYRIHHQDAPLNLLWFAGGREVFSETGYQALPDSGSSRVWNSISASHNTVTVDESMDQRSPARLPESLLVPEEGTPAANERELVAALPAATSHATQGRLLVWHARNPKAQAMEAERERAYPGVASRYRRTLVLLGKGGGDGILVDIFRIRGGRTHDFALRGGLDEAYTMSFDAALEPASGVLYEFVQLRQRASVKPPLRATVEYADGYRVRSWLSALTGTAGAETSLLVGEAPAIRRLGTAPFSFLRHQLRAADGALETCYVWVHESGREATLRSVKTHAEGGNLIITLERDDREDILLSGEEDASLFAQSGLSFTGRLALASRTGSTWSGTVFSGGPLKHEGSILATASPALAGVVEATQQRRAGAGEDSLRIRLEEGASLAGLRPYLVHIDFGEHQRFSIPVTAARETPEGLLLNLAHPPGFEMKAGRAVMTHSPGWAYAGVPTVRIECESAK